MRREARGMDMADITGFADLETQPLAALAPRERIL
jgi:hypothetical protein